MTEPDPREYDAQVRYTIPDGPPYAITGPLPDDHPQAPGWYFDRAQPELPAELEQPEAGLRRVKYDEAAAAKRRELETKLADLAIPLGEAPPWLKYVEGRWTAVGDQPCMCPAGAVYVGCPQHGNGRVHYSTAPGNLSIEIVPSLRPFDLESVDGLEDAWRHRESGMSGQMVLLLLSLVALGAVLAGIAILYGVLP
jgi:hypothetical protein